MQKIYGTTKGAEPSSEESEQPVAESETQEESTGMKLFIGEEEVMVSWEKNEAVILQSQ